MSEERAPYGPQIKFRTFIQYHLYSGNDVIQEKKNFVVECSSGIEAARAALSNLNDLNGRIANLQLFVSIDRTGK